MGDERRVLVVGSGASGVHFALSVLRKGYDVTLVDVGRAGREPVRPDATFSTLKAELEDPAQYFLGAKYEGLLLPSDDDEYYGIPPHKQYIFDSIPGADITPRGFAPLQSFARGGLAEAWTAGCYPFNDDDLDAFPFGYDVLKPHYEEVAKRIGITGADDDLARFFPLHDHLLTPLDLDAHSQLLIDRYKRKRKKLNGKLGCYVGRTRVATLSERIGERESCKYLGRCLWGCPIHALYTPSLTLQECFSFPNFTYASGLAAKYFRVGANNRVTSLVAKPLEGGPEREFPIDRLVLAAGTLSSSRIVLQSVLEHTGEAVQLTGLMDNRQILMPFVNMGMIGRPYNTESYQYHLLGMGIETDDPRRYLHGQITTVKSVLMHPILQNLPFDLRTSTFFGRMTHAALGVVNINLPDTRRATNYVALSEDADGPRLRIGYAPSPDEPEALRHALTSVRRVLRTLGCIVPPGMTHIRPMGASVHYSGTFPMTTEPTGERWTTTPTCQSRDYDNLYLVDGSTFPFLPSKNCTFTLMANAARVAAEAF